jgi:peptidoglycan/xylan/chitin deacetylase (PgdA/CDA1 family)
MAVDRKFSPAFPPNFAASWRDAAQRPVGLWSRTRRFLRDTLLSLEAAFRQGVPDRFLRGLYCHYVFPDQACDFRRLLITLQRLGRFVDTGECLDLLEQRRPVDGRLFHLSFDDGFRNHRTVAAPILDELGIKAAFFVPTAVVGAPSDEVARYCRRIEYPAAIEMMDWDDVLTLHAAGHEIGSHTRTHARFSELSADPARLHDEIADSRDDLARRLGAAPATISWPFGGRTDADPASLAAVRAAGYRACFGAFRGTMVPGRTDLFAIPRHHFEVEWPVSHVTYFARGNREGRT